jgi:voltage-gated potassium channel
MTAAAAPVVRQHGNAYNIFILVLTVLSLGVMVLVVLPLEPAVHDVLMFYDNLICFVFLGDFLYNISGSRPRSEYFFKRRGWLDLLGSIPTLGIFRFTALFRLARLSRLARITRAFRGQNQKELVRDVVENRGQYALFITLLLVMLTLTISSVLVLYFETRGPDPNITTGGDALWWAFVTITTVGYGDYYPKTPGGRAVAIGVMFVGIAVIGALASILASLLVSSPNVADESVAEPVVDDEHPTPSPSPDQALVDELGRLRTEMAATRQDLDRARSELADLRHALAATGQRGPAQGP